MRTPHQKSMRLSLRNCPGSSRSMSPSVSVTASGFSSGYESICVNFSAFFSSPRLLRRTCWVTHTTDANTWQGKHGVAWCRAARNPSYQAASFPTKQPANCRNLALRRHQSRTLAHVCLFSNLTVYSIVCCSRSSWRMALLTRPLRFAPSNSGAKKNDSFFPGWMS